METLTALFIAFSSQYALPQGLLSSICYVESLHNVNAVRRHDGNGHSLGVCQIKLATAKSLGFKGTEQQLMDPKMNIKYAAKYLRYQVNRYNGSLSKAIVAYNRGNSRGLTTSKYQRKVYKHWRGY